jgi:hypothetical protein
LRFCDITANACGVLQIFRGACEGGRLSIPLNIASVLWPPHFTIVSMASREFNAGMRFTRAGPALNPSASMIVDRKLPANPRRELPNVLLIRWQRDEERVRDGQKLADVLPPSLSRKLGHDRLFD